MVDRILAKFIISMSDRTFQMLSEIASNRGIRIQELIRAVIIPDWFKRLRRENLVSGPTLVGTGPTPPADVSNSSREALSILPADLHGQSRKRSARVGQR